MVGKSQKESYLLALNFSNWAFVLSRREQANVGELSYRNFDLLDCSIGIVGNVNVDDNVLSVMIQLCESIEHNQSMALLLVDTYLLIKWCFQMQFVGRHNKIFAHFRAWLVALLAGRVHNFAYGQTNRISFVWLLVCCFCNISFQFVINTTRFSCVARRRLQRHRGRAMRRKLLDNNNKTFDLPTQFTSIDQSQTNLEIERICVGAKLFHQSFLQFGHWFVAVLLFQWKYLFGR